LGIIGDAKMALPFPYGRKKRIFKPLAQLAFSALFAIGVLLLPVTIARVPDTRAYLASASISALVALAAVVRWYTLNAIAKLCLSIILDEKPRRTSALFAD
jgi:hypothetical protein